MKFLTISLLAAMLLLQVTHCYSLSYDRAQSMQERLLKDLQQLQGSSQQLHSEELFMARERVRKLRDYNRETIVMLQKIQPHPRDVPAQTGETVELYSANPMGLPYFIPPNSHAYLDGIDGLLEHALHVMEDES